MLSPRIYRLLTFFFFPAALVIMAAVAYSLRYKPVEQPATNAKPIEDRRSELRQKIAEQEVESARVSETYLAEDKVHWQEMKIDFAASLKKIPGVDKTEGNNVETPVGRIIHFRDLHFVAKPLVALDMGQAYGRELTPAEIDILFEQHLLEVELVQVEQMAILRCLIRQHGLKRMLSEGLSPEDLPVYREKIAVLKAMERDDIPELRKQLSTVRRLREGVDGELLEKLKASESRIAGLLEGHKRRLLEVKSAGRLLIAGELEAVSPLEDRNAFEEAGPILADGTVGRDAAKIAKRNDAQVRAILKEGGFAVVMLGGSHDLSESIKRLANGKLEYLRVTTSRYQELAE